MNKFTGGESVFLDKVDASWTNYNPGMHSYVGQVGSINRVISSPIHGEQALVVFEDDSWWVNTEWLSHVKVSEEATGAIPMLEKAAALMRERGEQYDKPEGERSMGSCVLAFNAITGRDLKESEGWLLLQLLKDVRQWQNPDRYHADSAEDCIAYAALKAEALMEGK